MLNGIIHFSADDLQVTLNDLVSTYSSTIVWYIQ
jgi:hypothetical protein